MPFKVVRDTYADGRTKYETRMILVRPDQFIVWIGDRAADAERSCGRSRPEARRKAQFIALNSDSLRRTTFHSLNSVMADKAAVETAVRMALCGPGRQRASAFGTQAMPTLEHDTSPPAAR